jgi:hypothetical protein
MLLLNELRISSRVSASAIFESNFPLTSDKCDEIVADEEAVLTRLSRF